MKVDILAWQFCPLPGSVLRTVQTFSLLRLPENNLECDACTAMAKYI